MKEDVVAEWLVRTGTTRCACAACQGGPIRPWCEQTPCPDPRRAKIAPRFLRWTTQHDHKQRCLAADRLVMEDANQLEFEGNKSTKRCHWCDSDALALISTQDLKLCVDCGHQMKWKLDEGQKAVL